MGSAKLLTILVLAQCVVTTLAFGFEPDFKPFNDTHTTSGSSGPKCGRRKCLAGHECAAGKCQCPPGSHGDARIHCVPDGSHLCTLTADPHVHAFGGARVPVDLPCRYRVADAYVPLLPYNTTTTNQQFWSEFSGCRFTVDATNFLVNNEYYATTVDIVAAIETPMMVPGANSFRTALMDRIFAGSDNGSYVFFERGLTYEIFTPGGLSNPGPFYSNLTSELPITVDEENNLIEVELAQCGLKMKFRPPEITGLHLAQIPGISLEVPANTLFEKDLMDMTVENFNPGLSPCGTLGDSASMWENRAAELGFEDVKLAVIHDILAEKNSYQVSEFDAYEHPNHDACESTISYFASSSNVPNPVDTLKICGPILTDKAIRACILEKGKGSYTNYMDVMSGFYACVKVATGKLDYPDCELMPEIIIDCGLPWSGGPPVCQLG